jgi:hypothetical protein
MDAIRGRLGSALEWSVAVAFLAATLAVGLLIVRELRVQPRAVPVRAQDAPPAQPSAVPATAISVPVLLLLDGKEIRVGDPMERVRAVVGADAEVMPASSDRGALGPRVTRFYEHAGTRFIVVFEPFERNGAPRVAAIFLP